MPSTLDDKALRDLAHPMMDGYSFNNLFKAAEYGRLVRNAALKEAAEVAEEPNRWKQYEGDFEANCVAAAIRALIPPGET